MFNKIDRSNLIPTTYELKTAPHLKQFNVTFKFSNKQKTKIKIQGYNSHMRRPEDVRCIWNNISERAQ